MKLTTQTIKQFLLVSGLMALGLMLVNSFGMDFALAQGAVTGDQPEFISNLTGGETSLRRLVLRVVSYFLGFLGLLAVIMVIYGGFLYVSSAGNEENVNKAKKILLYAAIGVVVITLSFVLVQAILGAGTGTER